MHRFGQALLLNKYIPDLRVPKWAWLLKVKTFKNHNEIREKISAKAETLHPCVRAMVHFFHSARKFSKI